MMDDTISRQAAIDAAKKLLDYYGTNDISKEFADHAAERFMKRVPSAQPEPITVNIDHEFTQEEYKKLCEEMANAPIVLLPTAQPNLQPTCNQLATDCISRQAALDALEWKWAGKAAIDAIKNLPSAQQWIPCSERLPECDGDAYLVTDYCKQIDRKRIHVSYCYLNTYGFWSDVPLGYKVIAWMPLPKPYEGEEHG